VEEATGKQVVLIVEDEAFVRMNVVDTVEEAGFEVIEAANADMLGSMKGVKLAEAVRGRWPPIKIIATSGHYALQESELPQGGRFLPKPYTLPQVAKLLKDVIG
jgi:hypothetical protein